MAKEYGMEQGSSMDLRNGWDFGKKEDRETAREKLKEERPKLLIGSPECRMFSQLQRMNPRRDSEEWKRQHAEACLHVQFCCELYREQINRGGYVLHEHPFGASSWKLQCIHEIMNMNGMIKVCADQC